MDFGVGYFATHDAMEPGALAALVEEAGQESLFFAEHTHIPAARTTPYGNGGELPRKYWHTHDLFVTLTAAAVATSRLRVGSGVCLVTQRDPIITAKQVASIDVLPVGDWSSVSEPAGTVRRWRTTAPTRGDGWRCCANASRR